MSLRSPGRKRRIVERLLALDPRRHYCPTLLTADTATIDHLVPRSLAGTDLQANLVLACVPCNERKGNRPHSALCTCPAGAAAEAALRAAALVKVPPVELLRASLATHHARRART